MADIRYHYDNLIDYSGVTITGSSEVSTLPAENVANDLRTKVWRTSTPTTGSELLTDGDDLSTASWTPSAASVTGPTTYASKDFYKIEETATTAIHQVWNTTIAGGSAPGGFYRITGSLKAAERAYAHVYWFNSTIGTIYAAFDLTNGTATVITGQLGSTYDQAYASISAGSDGTWDIEIYGYFEYDGSGSPLLGVAPATGLTYGSLTYAGTLGNGVYAANFSVKPAYQSLVFDLGSAKAATSLILAEHTLDPTEMEFFKLQANSSDSWSSPAYSANIVPTTTDIYSTFNSQTYRYWRLLFQGGPQFDIGRVFLGTYVTATRFVSREGYSLQPVDRSETSRTLGGQTYTWQRDPYKRITLQFSQIDDTQKAQFVTLADAVGTHTPFFVYMTDMHTSPIYVKLAALPAYQNAGGVSGAYLWDVTLELEEQL